MVRLTGQTYKIEAQKISTRLISNYICKEGLLILFTPPRKYILNPISFDREEYKQKYIIFLGGMVEHVSSSPLHLKMYLRKGMRRMAQTNDICLNLKFID